MWREPVWHSSVEARRKVSIRAQGTCVPPAPNKLLEGPILRSLLTLAVPIVAANVLQSAYQIIDAFWVGRMGGAAVAAVSISFPVLFLTFAIGSYQPSEPMTLM